MKKIKNKKINNSQYYSKRLNAGQQVVVLLDIIKQNYVVS